MKKSFGALILLSLLITVGNSVKVGAVDESPSIESPDLESSLACGGAGLYATSAGDVNGDGFCDAIVGVPYGRGEESEGSAYLYSGSAFGLTTRPLRLGEGDAVSGFGFSVASAGDVNGDGYSDVIVGGYDHQRGGKDDGAAFFYMGSARGLDMEPQRLDGGQAGSGYGFCVASAGDVNGDGYSDIVVGAPFYDGDIQDEGAVFLYFGSASGPEMEPLRLGCGQASSGFGFSVASAGDVNGDGYSDVIVGAPRCDVSQRDEGAAFLFMGSGDGPTGVPFILNLTQSGAGFGFSVASVGDVDGDGFADLIVGAPYYDNGQPDEGAAFLYMGSSIGFNFAPAWMEADRAHARFGWSVATAGDVNKDGYGDVLVGAPSYVAGETGEGLAFLFRGSSSGLAGVDYLRDDRQANSGFGWSVASAGDVDGDGYGDVFAGSCGRDLEPGKVYLYPRGKLSHSLRLR